jgi:hypothetical protein
MVQVWPPGDGGSVKRASSHPRWASGFEGDVIMNTVRRARRQFALGFERLEAKQLLSLAGTGTTLGLAGGPRAAVQTAAVKTTDHARTVAQKGVPANARITNVKALAVSVTEGQKFHLRVVTFTVANGGKAPIGFDAMLGYKEGPGNQLGKYFENLSAVVSPVSVAARSYAFYVSGTCIAVPPVKYVAGQLLPFYGINASWYAGFSSLKGSQDLKMAVNDVPLRAIEDNTTITATPGVSTGVIALAGFIDSNPLASFSNTKYQVEINWDDQNAPATGPNANDVTFIGLQDEAAKNYICCTPDNWEIYSHHTFSEPGKYDVTITVTDDPDAVGGAGKQTLSLNATVIVSSPPTLYPLSAVESEAGFFKFSGPYGPDVALTFTYPKLLPTDLSATINWGDSTPADTAIVQIAPAPPGGKTNPNLYAVVHTHVYQKYGTYTLTVTIKNKSGTTVVGPLTEQVQVADAQLVAEVSSANVPLGDPETGYADFTGTLGYFGPDTWGTGSDYKVTINWGDSTNGVPDITPGEVAWATGVPQPSPGDNWVISGSHQFNISGVLPFNMWNGSVTIVDPGGETLTAPVTFIYGG